jgi:hypothetical protein
MAPSGYAAEFGDFGGFGFLGFGGRFGVLSPTSHLLSQEYDPE